MAAARNRTLGLAAAGLALLLAASLAAYRPVAPRGANAPPELFSAQRTTAILRDLVGNGIPHPLGSPASAQLREAIVARLRLLGFAPELQSGFACDDAGVCGYPVNIVAMLAGRADDGDAVILSAHYDSVPAGPGASDDGAGVASMLEIARILKSLPPPRHPIVFLFTDGEEAGLLGARLFVREHPWSKRVMAAVNLESRGTSGPSLMFETGTANTWLMDLYRSAIARPVTNSLYYVVYRLLPNDTDFTVYKQAHYQGFNFAYIGHVGRYHTPLDSVANADPRSIQQQGDNALGTLRALANAPTLRAADGESVFFDGFSRMLIAWPSGLTFPAALFASILLLAEGAVLLRAGSVKLREILWAWMGALGAAVVGTVLCAGVLVLLVHVQRVPPLDGASWISRPLPMNLAAAAIAVLVAAGADALLARRAGFWGFWLAASLQNALLGIWCALVVPGASYIFLLTALAAGVAALPHAVQLLGKRTPADWTTDVAALIPILVIFGAVLPLLMLLYTSLGSVAWPLTTLVLSLAGATLLPILAAATLGARRLVIVLAALMVAGGMLATLRSPPYSADWPERINLEYWLDADTGQSHFLARCESRRLPAALAAAGFDPVARPRFEGSAAGAFFAAAPVLPLPPPELSTASAPARSQSAAGPAVRFDVQLRSARGASEAFVVFPAAARVGEVVFAAASGPVPAKTHGMSDGGSFVAILGLPPGGVQFGFDAAAEGPLRVQVFDQSGDFPQGQTLQRARPANATSSQDGDVTVVHRTVTLDPAAGRPEGPH